VAASLSLDGWRHATPAANGAAKCRRACLGLALVESKQHAARFTNTWPRIRISAKKAALDRLDGSSKASTRKVGNVSTLDDAVAAFNPTKRIKGKTIIRVRP
jgi:hypothetical protein